MATGKSQGWPIVLDSGEDVDQHTGGRKNNKPHLSNSH